MVFSYGAVVGSVERRLVVASSTVTRRIKSRAESKPSIRGPINALSVRDAFMGEVAMRGLFKYSRQSE